MVYNGHYGLYLVKRKGTEKGVDHYGILDIGNRTRNPHVQGGLPFVVHLMPAGFQADWLRPTDTWIVVEKVLDENNAAERLNEAWSRPEYNLLVNNCEHFARYVATGISESKQVQTTVAITMSLVALPLLASALDNTRTRQYRRR